MARGQKQYTDEFKKTIVELYNTRKSLSELSSEYAVAKSTITSAEYKKLLNKNAQLKEGIEILKKAMGIFARK